MKTKANSPVLEMLLIQALALHLYWYPWAFISRTHHTLNYKS